MTFATIRVYFAGVTMARQRLRSPDPRARRLAWAPLLATVAAAAVVAVPLARAVPVPPDRPFPEIVAQVGIVTTTGLPGVVLWPFRALIAPVFAQGAVPYVGALAGSLVVLLASIAWVLKSDEVFLAAIDDSEPQEAWAGRANAARAPRAAIGRLAPRPFGPHRNGVDVEERDGDPARHQHQVPVAAARRLELWDRWP